MSFSLPDAPAHIHFVGIGGIGMSGLARILAERGNHVTGSDSADSPLIVELRLDGIAVAIGHADTETASQAQLIVATAAVTPDNPELRVAQSHNVPVIKRAALLGLLAAEKTSIAVAGSHGKSTTSAMITSALRSMHAMPSYAIGAILKATGRNAEPGAGMHMVVEADEYDRSFHALRPDFAVITNIDYDHPDIYPTPESYREAFLQFAHQVSSDGALVVSADDAGALRLGERLRAEKHPVSLSTFGFSRDADWQIALEGNNVFLLRFKDGQPIQLQLQVPGAHNAANAAAAVAILAQAGFDANEVGAALAQYQGIGRRFEFRGRINGVELIDDYAHHPAEIAATLQAARKRYPDRRLWAVFQPHTFSRTHALQDDFREALAQADRTMVLNVYASREMDQGLVRDDDLRVMAGETGYRAASLEESAARLQELVEPGDVLLTLGAGSITNLPDLLAPLLGASKHSRSECEGSQHG